MTVPRSITVHRESVDEIELHAFGDASKKGVAAAVYAITKQASGVNVGLVTAKARLAKQDLTLPRLELVSAHMATNLVSYVKKIINDIPVISVFGWLDSSGPAVVTRGWRVQTICSQSVKEDSRASRNHMAPCTYTR